MDTTDYKKSTLSLFKEEKERWGEDRKKRWRKRSWEGRIGKGK
jgi:hypothetical protein